MNPPQPPSDGSPSQAPRGLPPQALSRDGDDIDLAELAGTLWEGRWIIAAITMLAVFVGGLYVTFATPIYRSDVLLQVEDKEAGVAGLDVLAEMFTGETPAEAEIEIIRSRTLLGKVVDQLHLDLIVQPKRFPLIGDFLARRWGEDGVREAPLGLDSFAWGGERLVLSRLEVLPRYEGEQLTLIVEEGQAFRVEGPEGELLARGVVGEAAGAPGTPRPGAGIGPVGDVAPDRASSRAPGTANPGTTADDDEGSAGGGSGGGAALFVAAMDARPGTEFFITRMRHSRVVAGLQSELSIFEKGKKTGILKVELSHRDPERLANILDAIAEAYLRQNVERRSEEAATTLTFLEEQLPEHKARLEAAEAALNDYRARIGRVDLTLEAQASLDQAVEIEKQLASLEMQREELERRFTPNHPRLAALRRQASELERNRQAVETRLRGLPEAELASARLMRDVQVANALYLHLLNQAQELRVVKSGTIGNVRILDTALVTQLPAKPKKPLTLALSLLLGGTLGVGFVFGRRALDKGLEDPDVIERATNLPVYASVPHSPRQTKEVRALERSAKHLGEVESSYPILAALDGRDPAIESIRSLRTVLQFARLETKSNVITITGPAPGIGKSFIALNLAHVLAQGGKRVLLVDADLRKGQLHRAFGGGKRPGLSELIQGSIDATPSSGDRGGAGPSQADGALGADLGQAESLEAVLVKGGPDTPDFIGRGSAPPNPAELLMSERFATRLRELSEAYDWVLFDTPPLLAVTDAALVGRLAGLNLMVLQHGQHPSREITQAQKAVTQAGAALRAVVLNDVPRGAGRGQYGYSYRYDYYGS